MNTILVDDELWMMKRFEEECLGIEDIELVGMYNDPLEALEEARQERIDLAFLDIEMPGMTGLELADKLRAIYPKMIVIFVSAYDDYLCDALRQGADYYVLKPYTRKDVEDVLERAKLSSRRLDKRVFIHTFGRFNVYLDGKPLTFSSPKAKELLALLVDRRGDTVSNEEAFTTIWEQERYSQVQMDNYHKVLRRLRDTLAEAGITDLLVSLPHEHKVDTEFFDCDYYRYLDGEPDAIRSFDGRYMSEYSWGEYTLARLVHARGIS